MSVIAVLSTHTNLVELCQKYNFSKDQIKHSIEECECQITNEIIPISKKKNIGDWDNATKLVKEILKTKLKSTNRVQILLAVIHDIDGLVNSISISMINQLKKQFDYQGSWARLTSSTISDQFQYFEKFATTDETKGNAEYLEVTGEGHIEYDTKAVGTNQLRLNVRICFRAITMMCGLIALNLSLPASSTQLLRELKWHGIKNQSIH